jgi:hypothetical protein
MDNFSLAKYECANFHSVLLNSRPFQPIATLLIKITLALIDSEPKPDEVKRTKVMWIYKNTHEKVKEHLSIIELAVFRNLGLQLNREIEIGNKTFKLTELYKYLDEVNLDLSSIVMEIAKKYNLDIPFTPMNQSQQIRLGS